jgi:hypothetical protein
MWCDGSSTWMVVGSVAMLAFWGTAIWLIVSLLRTQRNAA